MYVPSTLLLRSLYNELSAHFAEESTEASVGQSVTSAVRLLEVRERGGAAFVARQLDQLDSLLTRLSGVSALASLPQLPMLRAKLDEAWKACGRDDLDRARVELVEGLEAMMASMATTTGHPVDFRLALARILADWEIADRGLLVERAADGSAPVGTGITSERFEAYLRDRFVEHGLRVATFRPLSGGFGKQTILVSVVGKALDGSLVIRRDPEVPTVDNDCHRVRNEYSVIRAVFERGFAAPEALWVDTEHVLLPGGDFLVMRMSPGRTGGNVFGSTEVLGSDLLEALASAVARLHTLPPLIELGDLTDSIRRDRWGMTLADVTRNYIRDWLDLYRANAHNASPTLMTIYGWLLDNIPDAPGRPVLVHGDVGFHNMLIDQGRLTALVDWEFAHIGDPAEDMGAIRNSLDDAVWDDVMARYRAAGGPEIDPVRLHFFRVWHHARNASASNLAMGKFQTGEIPDLKLAYSGHYHFPIFLKAAWELIEAGPGGATSSIHY